MVHSKVIVYLLLKGHSLSYLLQDGCIPKTLHRLLAKAKGRIQERLPTGALCSRFKHFQNPAMNQSSLNQI